MLNMCTAAQLRSVAAGRVLALRCILFSLFVQMFSYFRLYKGSPTQQAMGSFVFFVLLCNLANIFSG